MSQGPDSEEKFDALLRDLARGPGPDRDGAAAASLVGKALGHYRILSVLGQGGLGTVYLAEDTRLLRQVALKLVHPGAGALPEREAVLLEARAAAAVVHPNVASVYGVEEHEGRAVLVMEYVSGQTLRTLIPEGGMGWREAWRTAEQVALGLRCAHALGIVHRDLKPDNVMVTREGVCRILDFGLARSERPAAPPGGDGLATTPAGTPRYMAPELLAGARADRRSDVFALGVMLHELLTGLPGKAGDPPPRQAPAAFAGLTARCLEKDPARRPQDALELVAALERCSPRNARRRTAGLLVAGATVAVVGLALWLAAGRAPRPAHFEQLTRNSVEAPVMQAALSPDGRTVAFVDTRGLLLLDLATRQERQILSVEQVDLFSFLSWFSDGRLLVRLRERDGLSQLAILDGPPWAKVTPVGGLDVWRFAAPSPDGNRIAYLRSPPGARPEVGLFEVARPEARRALFSAEGEDRLFSHLAWSPDGARLAFGRYVGKFDVRDASLLVAEVASGAVTTVLRSSALYQQSYAAAFAFTAPRTLAWAAAPRSGDLQELKALEVPAGMAEAGPGKLLATFRAPVIDRLTYSAQSRRFALVGFAKQADVWLGNLGEGAANLGDAHRLTLSERDEWPSGWSADDSSVLLTAEVEQGPVAAQVPRAGGVVGRLAALEGWSTWPVEAGPGSTLFWRLAPESGASQARLFRLAAGSEASALPVEVDPGGMEGAGRPPPRQAWVRCASGRCVLARQQGEGLVLDELAADGGLRRLGGPLQVAWTRGFALSADGQKVAVPDQARKRLLVAALDGTNLRELRAETGVAQFASFTPDGSALVVSTLGGGRYSTLERWGLDGSRTLLLASDWAWLTHPQVSHDGRALAWAATPFHGNVWLVEP